MTFQSGFIYLAISIYPSIFLMLIDNMSLYVCTRNYLFTHLLMTSLLAPWRKCRSLFSWSDFGSMRNFQTVFKSFCALLHFSGLMSQCFGCSICFASDWYWSFGILAIFIFYGWKYKHIKVRKFLSLVQYLVIISFMHLVCFK